MKAQFRTTLAASIIAGLAAVAGVFQPLQANAQGFEIPRIPDVQIMLPMTIQPPMATLPPMLPPQSPLVNRRPIIYATPRPLPIAHQIPAYVQRTVIQSSRATR